MKAGNHSSKQAAPKLLLVWFVLLALPAGAVAQNAQDAMTNEAVIQMVQAHLGVDVILQQIRSNSGKYRLDYKSLIELKQVGVPGKVIAATMAKNSVAPIPERNAMPEFSATNNDRATANQPAAVIAMLSDISYDAHGVTTDAGLLTVLDNSIWVPEGNRADKQIYAIAGPCCSFSKATYEA